MIHIPTALISEINACITLDALQDLRCDWYGNQAETHDFLRKEGGPGELIRFMADVAIEEALFVRAELYFTHPDLEEEVEAKELPLIQLGQGEYTRDINDNDIPF